MRRYYIHKLSSVITNVDEGRYKINHLQTGKKKIVNINNSGTKE